SDWANLPQNLLDSILERLTLLSDYLRFNIVCASWHSVAKHNKSRRAKTTTPMLLLQTKKRGTWSLYNVEEDKVLNLQLKIPNKRFCGSSKEWLIFVDRDLVVTLVNPFFRVKGRIKKENSIICLPPLNPQPLSRYWFSKTNYFVFKATISADPILNANYYIVVVIYEEFCRLAFIRPGKDTIWTYVDERWSLIEEVVPIRDKFYAVDRWGNLLSFDSVDQFKCNVESKAYNNTEQRSVKQYLVALNEKDFIMVERYNTRDDDSKRETMEFKVFEFSFVKCDWVETNNLGDVAIFVGDNSSIYVVASNDYGCQSNCIYFTHDYYRIRMDFKPWGPNDIGVYNIKTRSISQPFTENAMTMMKLTNRPPIWIAPPF
ncbi:unnamed protein product, partial [Prunus brigantina]